VTRLLALSGHCANYALSLHCVCMCIFAAVFCMPHKAQTEHELWTLNLNFGYRSGPLKMQAGNEKLLLILRCE